jgi:hypothetical protein
VAQLQMSIESYKQLHNDYPPDFTSISAASDLQNAGNVVVRHLRRAFPKHSEDLVTVFQDNSGNLLVPDPSEALVSWLSGLSKDPRKPITSNSDRNVIFPFVESRLRDLDNDGLDSYLPPSLSNAPYVYFDSRTYGVASYAFDVDGTGTQIIDLYPYRSNRPLPAGQTHTIGPQTQWMNPKTFQIIAAGLDDEFGVDSITAVTEYKIFPDGRNFSDEDWDNISNFSDGKTFEDNTE